MSSTSFAVINDSIKPTSAIPTAKGTLICSVTSVIGTSVKNQLGKDVVNLPSSCTFGKLIAKIMVTAVSNTIATSGPGTTVMSLRTTTMIATAPATMAYTGHVTPMRCGI